MGAETVNSCHRGGASRRLAKGVIPIATGQQASLPTDSAWAGIAVPTQVPVDLKKPQESRRVHPLELPPNRVFAMGITPLGGFLAGGSITGTVRQRENGQLYVDWGDSL